MGSGPSVSTPEARMMADMPIEYTPLQVNGVLEFRPDGSKVPMNQKSQHNSNPTTKYKDIINDARDQRVMESKLVRPVCPSCARADNIGQKCRICGQIQTETPSNSPIKTQVGDAGHDTASTEAIVHLMLDAEALKRRKTSHQDDTHELYVKAQQRRLGRLSEKSNVTCLDNEFQKSKQRAIDALQRISAMRAKLYDDDETEDSQFGPGVVLKSGSALPEVNVILKASTPHSLTIIWDSDAKSKATMAAICRSMNGGKSICYNVEYRQLSVSSLQLNSAPPVSKSTSQSWSRVAHHVTELELTVSGLAPNTQYEFRVRRLGWGPWSSPKCIATAPGPPSSPMHFRATEVSSSSVLLVWKPPEKDNGLPVIGYTINVRKVGEAVASCRYQGSGKFYLASELEANSVTIFELAARNSAGKGAVAVLAVRTLPTGSKDITPWEADINPETEEIIFRHQKSGTLSDHLPPGALLDEAATFRNKRQFLATRFARRSAEARRNLSLAEGATTKIIVPRHQLVQESFRALSRIPADELLAVPLRVNFVDEEGIDAGGIVKDWFGAVAKELLLGPTCLVCTDEEDLSQLDVRANRVYDTTELSFWCEFVGVFFAKALIDAQTIGLMLSPVLIAQLCDKPVNMDTISESFPSYHQGLVWIKDNDVEEAELTFSASILIFDKPETFSLIEGGEAIPVTDENKDQYVQCMVEWLANKRYEPMLSHVIRGFRRFIPSNFLSWFSLKEIQLLLGGQCSMEVTEIAKDHVCSGGFSKESQELQWLWETLADWNMSQLSKFLAFCTGCASMPVDGLQPPLTVTLMGGSGVSTPQKIIDGTLPRAHTCFNQLVLPPYSSKSVLEDRLLFALDNTGKEFVMA